jgi:energy-coupling factor transporter ATP-binding protein EcfA2
MSALRHRHPGTFPAETQRVVIASALAMQPKILILDEAFSRLTAQATAMLLARLQQWAQEQHALVILSNATLHLSQLLPAGMAAARRSIVITMLTLNQSLSLAERRR